MRVEEEEEGGVQVNTELSVEASKEALEYQGGVGVLQRLLACLST
jgi:hypothetical protein